MPKILTLKECKYKNQAPYKHENKSSKFYNTPRWSELRHYQLIKQPLCEECLKQGISTLATDCHHIQPFLRGLTEEQQWSLFLDESNLMSLCEECHHKIHRHLQKT